MGSMRASTTTESVFEGKAIHCWHLILFLYMFNESCMFYVSTLLIYALCSDGLTCRPVTCHTDISDMVHGVQRVSYHALHEKRCSSHWMHIISSRGCMMLCVLPFPCWFTKINLKKRLLPFYLVWSGFNLGWGRSGVSLCHTHACFRHPVVLPICLSLSADFTRAWKAQKNKLVFQSHLHDALIPGCSGRGP